MQLVIEPVATADSPTILFGFCSGDFSQTVFLKIDKDPAKCIEMANSIHDQFISACAEAAKPFNLADREADNA